MKKVFPRYIKLWNGDATVGQSTCLVLTYVTNKVATYRRYSGDWAIYAQFVKGVLIVKGLCQFDDSPLDGNLIFKVTREEWIKDENKHCLPKWLKDEEVELSDIDIEGELTACFKCGELINRVNPSRVCDKCWGGIRWINTPLEF